MPSRLVLIVTDDIPLRDEMSVALRDASFQTAWALDADGALTRISEERPDVLCVDLSLPRGSGYDVCERVRACAGLERLPILIMSDRSTPEDLAYAEEAGANAFLRKPFNVGRIDSYIETVLHDPHAATATTIRELRPSQLPPPRSG